ncbi:MAG: hypothetical protein Q6361_01120 [Candidatus Hermodarchaeota archaeon]|nr:hypothetical protein [Candidatus Hermodarchaeota archaeon]
MNPITHPLEPIVPQLLWVSVFLSWGLAILIEGRLWVWFAHKSANAATFETTLGRIATIQCISSPLSYGIALLFSPAIPARILWEYPPDPSVPLILLQSLTWNPWGIFLGFLIIPTLLEALFWRKILKKTHPDKPIHWVLQRSALANTTSFLVGVGISYLISESLWFFPGLLFLGTYTITLWLTVFVAGLLSLYTLRWLWTSFQWRRSQKLV